MPDVISNTSPLQYLHQIGHLALLESLAGRVIVPAAVRRELDDGRIQGVDLPDVTKLPWIEVCAAEPSKLLAAGDLGPGETEVLSLGLSSADPLLILDDALARQVALAHHLAIRGTLGILLDAKHAGLIAEVRPLIDRLQALGFRLSKETRAAVLRLAKEASVS